MKRIVSLLIICGSLYALSGCMTLEYPIDLYLDGKFDEDETVMIVWAVGAWNHAITARTGMRDPAFRIVGTFSDEYDIEDSEDDYHVIYKVTEPTPAILRMVEQTPGETVGGHATMSDIIVLRYNFPKWSDRNWPHLLRVIVLHEFGHMLGITHFEHRYGIMNAEVDHEMIAEPYITDADMDAYCHVHGCDQ